MESADVSGFRWSRVIASFRRWWWLVIGLALAGAAGGYLVQKRQPSEYLARAQMWVRGKIRVSETAQFTEDQVNFFGTQVTILQSISMRDRALRRLKAAKPDFVIPRDARGNTMSPKVRVVQTPKSTVFSLECTAGNPQFATDFLNALMDDFLAYRNEIRAATANDVLASVSEQIGKQERALKLEQEKLSEFQRKHSLVLVEEQARGGGNQLAQLNSQLTMLKLEYDLMDAALLERKLNGGKGATNALISGAEAARYLGSPAGTGLAPASEMMTARQRLQVLTARKEEMGRYLKPKHPKMVTLQDEILRTEKLLEFLGQNDRMQLETAKEAMKIRIESLEKASQELQVKVQEANRLFADYQELRAGVQRQQQLYDQLLAILRNVDVNTNIDQESFAVLERAGKAVLTKRSVLFMTAVGGGMAAFLGLGLVFLIARLDDRCETLEDVESEFGDAVVGQIPEVRISRKHPFPALVEARPGDEIFAEACRGLRSTLLFRTPRESAPPRTVLFTSAVPSEGKSTVAMNLAQALAVGGGRVLLVDGDLRRGHLHEMLKVDSKPGLVDLVDGTSSFEACAVTTKIPNLTFIPRGTATNLSGELFLSARFEELLRDFRSRFQFVIIDTVPVLAADDAATLASMVDGVLFVLRRGSTGARLARTALEALQQRQANILGVVFNRINSSSRSYRYYKYPSYYGAVQ